MSNSSLVDITVLSPNCNKPRNHKIDTITIHHCSGVISVENLGRLFANPGRRASSNYGIDSDGRVGLYVDEENRSWCSSSSANDNRAITIEVSNNVNAEPWSISDKTYSKLLDLVTDICKRNGIDKLTYTGDITGNLTRHCFFADTDCPGTWIKEHTADIVAEVNKRLGNAPGPSPSPTPSSGFSVGDKVKIIPGAVYTNGVKVPKSCIGVTYTVQSVATDRCLLQEIYSWVANKYLSKGGSTSSPAPSGNIKPGSKVKIKSGAVYTNGVKVPKECIGVPYTVRLVKSNPARSLLQEIYSWVLNKYLEVC